MSYVITRAVLGQPPHVAITKREYDTIRDAKNRVVEVVSAEETWDALRENYSEFEHRLLELTVRNTIFLENSWARLMDERLFVGRLLANLLSTCRSYLDTFPHHLSAIFGKNDPRYAKCDSLRKTLHSQRFGYRFMEALRNYSQHRGSPVHSLGFGFRHGTPHGSEFVHHPRVNVELLRSDKKFSRKVIAEIDSGIITPSKHGSIELKPLLREYVQALAEVHEEIRKSAKGDLANWEGTLQGVMSQYSAATSGGTLVGLAAARVNAQGYLEGIVYILEDLLMRREHLQVKNVLAKNGVDRFVSSRR